MGSLDGKVALVSGAGAGIGRASALEFARQGAEVVVADVDERAGQETSELIDRAGGRAVYMRCDSTVEAEVEATFARAVARFGRLDCAHNNVGGSGGQPDTPIAATDRAWWEATVTRNLTATMLAMKYELRVMMAQGGGSIVNTSSVAGLAGRAGMSSYSASKWGVIGLTRTAAREYGRHGVRVNVVCPGMTATQAVRRWAGANPDAAAAVEADIPLGRIAGPQEQARPVVWLCTDDASYVTGAVLAVDGGLTS